MRPHVVHIGYHRTASTWLQVAVFPRLRGVRTSMRDPVARELLENLSRAEDDALLEETFRAYLAERGPEPPIVFTRESLSGDPPDLYATSYRNAERLKRLLPEARILAVVRRQEDLVRSLYWLYVRLGGARPFADFVADRAEGWRFDPRHLEFDRLLGRYVELFGREQVLVLPYELLRVEPERFLADVTAFCGAEGIDGDPHAGRVNRSLGPTSLALLRTWNRAVVGSRYNPAPRFGSRSGARRVVALLDTLDPALRRLPRKGADAREIAGFVPAWAESNVRLQELCAAPLAELGYSFPAA